MYVKTLSVSALNNYIKKVLDNDFILSNSSVKGEISNFKLHTSGHIYFSLKDSTSKIHCVMFKSAAQSLTFMPEDGMNVIIKGRISVYEKDGTYQLYAQTIELDGIGELYVAFEKLKSKLQLEGLFNEEHKKSIPKYVRKIGIVTSPTGAAIRDIINVVRRRNKTIELLIYPALVQGINASIDIIKGIEFLNSSDVDVIILARGGGSIEELWAFNDEKLAYTINKSKKPIITGVGHEIDFTIADFAADRRAPTPSAAAEIAAFDYSNILDKLQVIEKNIDFYIDSFLGCSRNDLDLLKSTLQNNNPEITISNHYKAIDSFMQVLELKILNRLRADKEKLSKMNALLVAHNPLNVLNRGYSVITDEENKVVSSIATLKGKRDVVITLKDGSINTKISFK